MGGHHEAGRRGEVDGRLLGIELVDAVAAAADEVGALPAGGDLEADRLAGVDSFEYLRVLYDDQQTTLQSSSA